jgi:hypothetical protein
MQDVGQELLYKIGDVVPVYGAYICIPCGYIQEFNAGDLFITCEACLAGTPDGPEGYQDLESEFWQLFQ